MENKTPNMFLAKQKWEKATPEEKIKFLNLNNFSEKFSSFDFISLPIGIKSLIGLKMSNGNVSEGKKESTNIYWKDVTPEMDVKQVGNAYVANKKGVYWLGHEASRVYKYLDSIIKKNNSKEVKKESNELLDNTSTSYNEEESKFLLDVLNQVEADNDNEEMLLKSLKNKIKNIN